LAQSARIAWDFGDGETALGQTVQHSYSKPGVYSVALTVVGTEGVAKRGKCSNVSQSTAIVRVVSGPIADFTYQGWIAVGDTVVLDASASSASDNITSYTWSIGGDTLKQGDLLSVARSGARTTHRFQKPGVYPVTLSSYNRCKNCLQSSKHNKVCAREHAALACCKCSEIRCG
jgi:PKD repeat protein